jgi:hypothetical protein
VYRNIRIIHLIAGLLTAPLLFMYALSAIQMGHRSWFNLKPMLRVERIAAGDGCQNPRALAASLMRSHGWRGELTGVRSTASGCSFEVNSLGTTRAVQCDASTGSLQIRISQLPAIGLLNRMHHAAGLWHPSAAMRLWAVVVALASIACAALAATGVWLWLLRKRERRLGLILVTANLLFSIVLLFLLRFG